MVSKGKLYSIQDAYTVSDTFPLRPHTTTFDDGLNYIRNSVKVVVDMYNGSIRFYVMNAADPVLTMYRRSFPGIFQELSQLPQI